MPKNLLLSLAIGCLMVACADHTSDQVVTQDLPPTPVNQPDSGAGQPAEDAPRGLPDAPLPGGNGTVTKGGNGSESGGSGNSGAPGDNRTTEEVEGSGLLPNGGEGGQPVPEPGTLLLVGSGLAAAALLRRRRRSGDAA